jgi:hypothetical protein
MKNALVAIALLAAVPALAEPVNPKIELKLGAFRNATAIGGNKEINYEVKNGTDKFLELVGVECGFYSADGTLVKTGGSLVYRINPGEIARHSAGAADSPNAVRATCRIDTVKP